MNLLNLFRRIAAQRFLNSSPSRQETINETADQAIARASQVDVMTDMVFLEDLREIGEQERRAVEEYRAKKLGLGRTQKGEAVGDRNMILCDNYQHGIGAVATALLCAATAIPTLAGGAGLLYWLASRAPKAEVVADQADQVDRFNEYDIEKWLPTEKEKAIAEGRDQ